MATAELAVAIPVLAIVLALVLGAVDYGISQVRCVDAARTAARMVARGDEVAAALGTARAGLPNDADVGIRTAGGEVIVDVSTPGRWTPSLGIAPAHARAVAVLEEGEGSP